MMFKFSVIIPNYNHAPFLEERINSVLRQTYSNFELIILDDCSTDGSREIIEGYRNNPVVSHIVFNDTNSGSPFLQWQKGLLLAKGEWIWIAESDDMAEPSFLEEAANAFSSFPSAGIFYCNGIIRDESNPTISKTFAEAKNKLFLTQKWNASHFVNGQSELNEYLKYDNTINNVSGVAFQKKFFTHVGTDFAKLRYYGDWYLYLQMSTITDIYYCNTPLNIYRKHKASLLNSPTSSITSRKDYFRILQLLYYSELVTNKKELLDHFCYHFLNIGFFTHSITNSWKIAMAYMQIDRKLAIKVLPRLALAKLFRKRYLKYKVKDIEYIETETALPGRDS
jgi:glycosyltransferase involved in cell wall biosynthesis